MIRKYPKKKLIIITFTQRSETSQYLEEKKINREFESSGERN